MKILEKVLVLVFSLLFLTACNKQEPVTEATTPALITDWKTTGFAVSGAVEAEQQLWIEKHIPWQHEGISYDVETEKISRVIEAGAYGGKIYRLHVVTKPPQGAAVRLILETYDTFAMEAAYTEILPQQLGVKNPENMLLTDMDVVTEQEFAFWVVEYEQEAGNSFVQCQNVMIYSDLAQNLYKADLLPAYQEAGIVEASYDTIVLQGECICDSAGNSYVRTIDEDSYCPRICVFSKDGTALMEYTMSGEGSIGEPFELEGELIFPVYLQQEQSTYLIWLDTAARQVKTLAVLEEQIEQVYGAQGNCVYYETREGIVSWDIVSGSRKQVFDFVQNGIGEVYQTMLVLTENQAPILRMYGTVNGAFKDWLVPLSETKIEPGEPVRIANLLEGFDRVESSVVIAGRDNPDYHYVYEEPSASEREEYRTRIFAELTAGKGPDVLYVSLEDMEILQRQGLLADLRTLLLQESLEGVWPGVIELGSVEETLVGLPASISVVSLIVSERAGAGESWTLDEMIALMEGGRLNSRLVQGNMLFAPRAALSLLLEWSLEDSFLIDWEKRESHFEDERFIKLLEYSQAAGSQVEEVQGDPLGEKGERMKLVSLSLQWEISAFIGTRDTVDGYFIGMPTEKGKGNYLECPGVLVVKKDVSDKEAVAAYLECFLSDEVQGIGEELSVRKLSTEDIVYEEDGEAFWQVNGGSVLYSLTVFEDGTTSLHEAKELLENCVPAPKKYEALQNIIMEEVQAYYPGEKSATEVAEIIDNRVQLYLDER